MKALETKRLLAMGVAPGILALGLDATISHFAGRAMVNPGQVIPVAFAPLATAALLVVAAPTRADAIFRKGARVVGALATAVGLLGTAFHGRVLAQLLAGTPITWAGLKAALAVAPPLFAPAGFAGIGLLIWALGSERVHIELEARGALPHAA